MYVVEKGGMRREWGMRNRGRVTVTEEERMGEGLR